MRFLKKIQTFSKLEAWYHSIIAVEPGNNLETRKINMAEELVDVIVIKTTWEKGSTTETPMPPTSTPQFVNYSFSQTDIYISEFFKLRLHPNWR